MYLLSEKIRELCSFIEQINSSEFTEMLKRSIPEEDILKELKNFESLIGNYYVRKTEVENKIQEFNNTVLKYALHDYSEQNKLDSESELINSLGLSINLLGEELNYSTVTTHYLNDIFNSIKDMLIVIDKQGYIQTINDATSIVLKYNKKELIKQKISAILARDIDFEKLIKGDFQNDVNIFISKNEEEIPVVISASHFVRGDMQEIGTVLVAKNISESLKAKEAIQRSEMNYRKLYESTTDAVMLLDKKGFFDCNNATLKVFGCKTKAEFILLHPANVSPAEQSTGVDSMVLANEHIETALAKGSLSFEWTHKRVDTGESFPAEVLLSAMEIDGKPILQAVVRDITERKQAEELLKKNEEQFRHMFDHAPLGYQSLNIDGFLIDVNQKWLDTLGYKKEEVIGKWFGDFLMPQYKAAFKERFPLFKLRGQIYSEFEMLHKDGSSRIIAFDGNIGKDIYGEFKRTHCILKDITGQRETEIALKKLTKRNEAILQSVHEIIMEVDNDKKYIWANTAGIEFFGDDVLGKEAFIYFEGKQETYNVVQPLFDGDEGVIYIESWQKRKDGKKRLLAWWCKTLKDENGCTTGAISSARDITEIKKAEAALKESEDKFKYVFTNSNVGKSITSVSGEININKAFCEMLGYSMEELVKLKWWEITHPDDIDYTRKKMDELISNKTDSVRYIKRFLHKDGSVVWTDLSSTLRRENDTPLYFMTTIVNISETKQIEKNLKESEEKYRQIAENITDVVWTTDLYFNQIYISPSIERLVNKSANEYCKMSMEEKFTPESLNKIYTILEEEIESEKQGRIEKNRSRLIEVEHYLSDKTTIWLSINVSFVRNNDGIITGIQGVSRDITERKHAEEALKKSEGKYRNIFSFAPMGIYLSTEEGKFINVNNRLVEMLGYESFDELMLVDMNNDVYWDKLERKRILSEYKQIDLVYNLQIQWKKKDQTPIWISLNSHKVQDDNNNILFFEGFVQDITYHREAEEKIKSVAKEWQETFNSVKDAIWIMGVDGKISRCNKASEELLGLKESEICHRYCWELMHQTDMPINECPVFCLKNSRKREVMYLSDKDRWFEITVDPMINDNGELTGIVHLISDITERKKIEETIQESEKRYRTLLESLVDMVYITDYHFKMLYANPSLKFQTGYSIEDFKENEVSFVHPADHEKVMSFIKDFVEGEEQYSGILENRFVIITEDIRWHSTIISKIDYLGTPVLQFICRDITEQKIYEAKLIESEEKYRRLHETMTDSFVQTDMSGKIINVNKSYTEMLGYSAEELYQLTYYDLTPAKWIDFENNIVETQIIPRGYSDIYEKEYIKKDGTVFPAELRTLLLKDTGGQPIGMWAIIRDISERKKIEETIKYINEELEQRVKIRTTQLEAAYNEMEAFTYSVSHDLRSPLRAIDGFSKMLLQDYSDIDPEAVRLLNIICQSSANMGKLIEDLLVFSRVGRANISVLPFKMQQVVAGVIAQIKRENTMMKPNINITELYDVQCDKTLTTQVWTNLINNAVKFSSKTKNPVIDIGSYKEAKEVVYFVKDNGVGFDMTYIDKLFGVFQRLHTTDEFEGTGIGLAIVRKAIVRQGGRVWAESEEGKGATFYFTLPI